MSFFFHFFVTFPSASQGGRSEPGTVLHDRRHLPESLHSLALNVVRAIQEGFNLCHLGVAAYSKFGCQSPTLSLLVANDHVGEAFLRMPKDTGASKVAPSLSLHRRANTRPSLARFGHVVGGYRFRSVCSVLPLSGGWDRGAIGFDHRYRIRFFHYMRCFTAMCKITECQRAVFWLQQQKGVSKVTSFDSKR